MSGIFGVFNRNAKPVDIEIVNTMLYAMSYWEPDDRGIWTKDSVALGHTMLWNSPESKSEQLPNKQNNLVITMDARLDNREELATKLDMADRPMEQIPDSDFILAAYQKWGEECPKYLLGDFAFVVWDEEKQQLFCARDHIGIKPFYYHLDDEKFVFANDIRALIADPGISKTVSDKAVAIYLTIGELWHPEITFFESVQKLPPATTMVLTSKEKIQKVYWRAEDSPKIRFDSLEEYSERLRDLLEDSVHKRLRSEEPIASHLSGGLDSSTIATIAARYLHSQDKALQVYNWVASPQSKDDYEYYEWANSRRIAELENINHQYIDLNAGKLSDIFYSHDIAMNDTVDLWYEFLVRHEAKKRNVRTILSGWGGDELITYSGRSYYSDILRQGKIIPAIRGIYKEAKKSKKVLRHFVARFYYKLIMPFFPAWLHCYLPKNRCEAENYLKCSNSAFVKVARNISTPKTVFTMRKIRKDQLDLLKQGHIVNRIESWASSGFKDKIEYSYPLLDKRIVEFALGIPAEMYMQEGRSRFLFRHAISGLLPEDIRWGNFKQELFRVKLLDEIESNAIVMWKKKFYLNRKGLLQNQYIDHELLRKEIELLNSTIPLSIEEKFRSIDSTEKSILVLSLAKYNKLLS